MPPASCKAFCEYKRRTSPAMDHKDPIDASKNVEATQAAGLAASLSPERRIQVEKSLKRKLDARCSLFVLIYIMNYLDRNNIAAARLGGLQEDLNINDTQYATCLSILYVGYILMQVRTIHTNQITHEAKVLTSCPRCPPT